VSADPPIKGSTKTEEYATRLTRLAGVWWKRLLPVQAPYKWHIHRLRLGQTLDVGCGAGRNLKHLGGRAVGVDHNRRLVESARASGFEAYTPEEFRSSPRASRRSYDSLLFAHVLEHMTRLEATALLQAYLPYLRPGGRLIVFTPQERGFAADPTHVEFLDFERLRSLLQEAGLQILDLYSFPLPRWAGRLFTYNEFVVIARLPAGR
jgi:2-polyprenyl-3-methyl-5-hydroxy-6-metoxy-1,4-benzoquinol methylase